MPPLHASGCFTFFEVEETITSMPNRKAVGPDELPAELLIQTHLGLLELFHPIVVAIWRGGSVPQERGTMPRSYIVIHKKNDRTECGNYHGIFACSTRWQGAPQGDRLKPEQSLRTGRYPAKRAVWLQTATVDDRDDRRILTTSTGAKKEHPSLHVLRRPHQSIRFDRPDSLVGRACSVWRTTEDARGSSSLPRTNASAHTDG